MRTWTIVSVSTACLLLTSCKGSDDARKLLPFGIATLGGTEVEFDGRTHAYDAGFDATGILLNDSDPVDWQIAFTWQGDVDPGLTDTTAGLSIILEDPLGTLYVAGPTTTSVVTLDVSKFASSAGRKTSGVFWGQVENLTDPMDTLTVEDGEFRAVRIP
jgi:hypothetical protein